MELKVYVTCIEMIYLNDNLPMSKLLGLSKQHEKTTYKKEKKYSYGGNKFGGLTATAATFFRIYNKTRLIMSSIVISSNPLNWNIRKGFHLKLS